MYTRLIKSMTTSHTELKGEDSCLDPAFLFPHYQYPFQYSFCETKRIVPEPVHTYCMFCVLISLKPSIQVNISMMLIIF